MLYSQVRDRVNHMFRDIKRNFRMRIQRFNPKYYDPSAFVEYQTMLTRAEQAWKNIDKVWSIKMKGKKF